MKGKRLLLTFVAILLMELTLPFFTLYQKVEAATQTHLGMQTISFNHFEDDPTGWATQGNGNYLQLGGYFIRSDVNQLRANWHQTLAPGVMLGGTALDSPTAYTPPPGYKIHSIASYAVYRMRTYLVQRDNSGCNGGLPSDSRCNPFYFAGDAGEDNRWAKPPNILSAGHWVYYGNMNRYNPGLGRDMLYYQWRTAQIRKQGDDNGAGGTPWLKYDFKIVPDGPTDPCQTNPNGPGCGGSGGEDGGGGEGPPNDPGPPPVSPPPTESCPRDISVSGSGSMGSSNMTADPNGKIIESTESSQFNVLRYGIPSSEFLKVEGASEKYLSDYRYQGMSGTVTYRVRVTQDYMLRWQEGNEIKYEHVRRDEYVPDTYSVSYWQIGHLAIYSFQDAIFRNYALPNEMVIIPNTQRVSASSNHNASVDAHVFPQNCQSVYLGLQTIEGGQSKPSAPYPNLSGSAGTGSRPPQVKNDYVNVDGSTSMSDGMATQNAPTPSPIPVAQQVRVERSSLQIDPLKVNKWQTPSSITALYQSIHTVNTGGGSREFTGYSPSKINTVTVHTPVVMYAKASDDKAHDQRTDPPNRSTPANPDTDRHAFILDRPFTVSLPTNGQHLDVGMAPGYGNRDYAKYTRQKQVKFPFDVYSETKAAFYPKETWINVPINMENVTFFLPVWVPEGPYTVKYRSIAINAPGELPEEHHANLNMSYRTPNGNMSNHVAYDTIEVDVVGRLFDFRVTDILDFNWGPVFRTTEGMIEHTGNHFWVGDRGIDGALRGNQEPFVLPIRHGSHPAGYKNVAVKTGYQFKFDMKSKGDMWRENDAIRITPSFYFVDKNGQNRRKVDVYYHNDSNYFVKIGSSHDKEHREVTLNEPLRNVPESQLWNTAEYYYRHPDRYGFRSKADATFDHGFIRYFERDYAKRPKETGPYGWQILNWNLRTFIGPLATTVPTNAMKPQKDAIASEQMWYGEYSLPADIYIVEEGKDIAGYGLQHRLNKSHPIFIRDGYLIVNFNIESLQNGNVNQPHLQYIFGELSNQWKREGFKYSFIDPYGYTFQLKDGDVLFYHGDQSSNDDFRAGVSH
ncbi:DUF5704 domain-containing protein [Bacillus sp. FJAT-29937]|uniref:DUF5704 domain-containing protein n=1 Tax=Bacillus sp. FJAT-29937 TaxID=1720553 RepID=UPI00083783FD|nr:DUF5704 domain-containing protein [Bacillus sp. FJAT-29937]